MRKKHVFRVLGLGQEFVYGGTRYIKTKEVKLKGRKSNVGKTRKRNAVNLQLGSLAYFPKATEVYVEQ